MAFAAGGVAGAAGLWVTGAHSYLLFHSFVELFGIVVAAAVFAVAWNSRRFTSHDYLTFVGIAYLFVGVLDLVHTLAYKGMGVFPALGANEPTQLWIAARGMESLSLLLSPLFLTRRVRPWATLGAFSAVTAILLVLIFPLGAFPRCYVDAGANPGLTPFKVTAEYVICVILLGALSWLWRRRTHFSPRTFGLIAASIVAAVVSEIAFTRYVGVYGDFNKLGHLLKAGSFLLMFKAVVEGSLTDPYQVLFRDLTLQQEIVRASEHRYRSLVELAPDALFIQRDGRIDFVNPAALQLFGAASPSDLLGRPGEGLFAAGHRGTLREPAEPVPGAVAPPLTEARIVRLDGETRDVELVAAAFTDRHGRAIQVVLHDITERKRAHEALHDHSLQLAEANRTKDEFLATLSHELRTPLNAILGWSQMLLQGRLNEDRTRYALEVIDRNAKAQVALINDVLDVSRIISGKLRLNVRRTDAADSLRAALDTVAPAAEAKRIRLVPQIAEDVVVIGDADRLQQVFWNLLSNAVKFTPEGGRIDVCLGRTDRGIETTVRDTGIGLDPATLPHLFERFWQADRSTTRRYGGLGLGLAIVRHLVELHGGRVDAHSDGPGQGTTFWVTLPAPVGAARVEALPVQGHATAPPAPAAAARSLAGLRVLVVEDQADARALLQDTLQELGAEVSLAATAREGVRRVQEWRPSIVLCDIGMPDEDGYGFIRQVRALPAAQGGVTPAIALTAYGRPEDRARSLNAGFLEHLTKPASPTVLAEAIVSVCGAACAGASAEQTSVSPMTATPVAAPSTPKS